MSKDCSLPDLIKNIWAFPTSVCQFSFYLHVMPVPGLSLLSLRAGSLCGYRCYFVLVMKQAGRCWVDVCHCYIDVRTDPRGLQPSTPLKAINLWPAAPCTVAAIRSISVKNTHTHIIPRAHIFNTPVSCKRVICVFFCRGRSSRHKVGICIFINVCADFIFLKVLRAHVCSASHRPALSFYESFLIPFSQPVEATHSIPFGQAAHTRQLSVAKAREGKTRGRAGGPEEREIREERWRKCVIRVNEKLEWMKIADMIQK